MTGTMVLIIGLVAVAAALMTTVLALALGSGEPTGVARSLAIIERRVSAKEVAAQELPAIERLLGPVFEHTRALGRRLSPEGTSERLARRLDLAGNPRWWGPERVMGAKGAALIAGAVLGYMVGGFGVRGLLFGAGAAAFGFWLPDILVYNLGVRRQDELRRGLADALDMLTVCVEAGQSFDGALLQVARSVTGPLAGEFARVLAEIQIGRSRSEAFSLMAERTTAAEAKNFVSALVQADRLGLPIGGVLREQSVQMRLVRRQLGEEKAQKVPVKILFPLLFCIFPALFVVIIGPGVIRMIEAFSHM